MGGTREPDKGGDLLRDERGGSYVQALILLALVALAALTAFKSLGGTVAGKAACTGEAVRNLSGSVRCAENSADGESASTSGPPAPEGEASEPPAPPPSYKDLSEEQFYEYYAVLENAQNGSPELLDFLIEHTDPRDRARLLDMAARFGLLGDVLDHSSGPPGARRLVAEALRQAFESGALTPEEFKRGIRGTGAGSAAGETHEELAAIVAATGDRRIIEAFAEGEIDVVRDHSEDARRLSSVAKALGALSPAEREAFFERRPDVETVMDIHDRHEDLRRADLPFVDTDLFTSPLAIRVVENPDNRRFIDDMARRYGVEPALLEGVIAAEIDFDRDRKDVVLDNLGRGGVAIGQGWGVAAVHGDSLDRAIDYMQENNLPGAAEAGRYNKDVKHKATFEGSVEAAAIVTAFYADVKRKHGGSVDSPEDMAVIWGAYRAGVAGVSTEGGGFASPEDFAQNRASGTDGYPSEFQIGGNAYQSLPFFEHFESR
jgi:hypothetical protein